MSEPSDTTVGHIVGYLEIDRSGWSREIREAARERDELIRGDANLRITTSGGAAAAAELGRLIAQRNDLTRRPADIRVSTSGGSRAAAQIDEVGRASRRAQAPTFSLLGTLAAIAPAAIPIAGVAGGALLGLVPTLLTVALGVSGIKDEMKSGALEGTKYGDDMATVQGWLEQLKTTAASGLLNGVDQAVKNSRPLIATLNSDIGVMSHQLGDIVGGAAPALLTILTQLNPLFVTFGTLISNGAQHLEHWAQSSTGVSSFVGYVQRELPVVMHDVGQLIVLISHLAQAGAPLGGVMLGGFGVLVHLLNEIPIPILSQLIDLTLAAYVGFKTYQGITFIVATVNAALEGHQATLAATAAVAEASALAVESATAQEAAAVATAQAEMATAAATAAAEIAAATAGTDSVLAAGAAAAATSAAEEAAAFQAAADAAIASAAEIAAAAEAAAAAVAASGRAAGLGLSTMLGPIGAVVVGVGILAATMSAGAGDTQAAAAAQNSYAESLKKTTNALAGVNIAQTLTNLTHAHALEQLDSLDKANGSLKLSTNDLALAVNGTQAQYDSVVDKIKAVITAGQDSVTVNGKVSASNRDIWASGNNLLTTLKTLRTGLDDQTRLQIALNEAQKQSQIITDGGNVAAANQARALGVTKDAYLAAQLAAQKNTDQTNAQALAFRLANDGGALLALTLDKLSGKKLGYQQALNSFQSQLAGLTQPAATPGGGPNPAAVTNATNRHAIAVEALSVAQQRYDAAVAKGNPARIASAHLALSRAQAALTASTSALDAAQKGTAGSSNALSTALVGTSAAAVQNRGTLISLVTNAEQAAEAYGKLHGGSEAARGKLIELRKELINQAVKFGENRQQVTKFVDSILTIPKPGAIPKTDLDVKTYNAVSKIRELQGYILSIKQGDVPGLDVNSTEGRGVIRTLQRDINLLKQGKKPPIDVDITPAEQKLNALLLLLSEGNIAGYLAAARRVGFTGSATAADPSARKAYGGTAGHAAGGTTVQGPGSSKSDSIPYWLSNGEEVTQEPYASGWRPFLKAINSGKLGPSINAPAAQRALAGVGGGAGHQAGMRPVHIDKFEQNIHYPEPEPVSALAPRAMRMASYELGHL